MDSSTSASLPLIATTASSRFRSRCDCTLSHRAVAEPPTFCNAQGSRQGGVALAAASRCVMTW